MRLQHGRSPATIPRAAASRNRSRILFCFRKNQNFYLRLAQCIATISGANTAVSSSYGWNHQSVEEQDCGCEDQEGTFHGCFLLVTASWTVIVSWTAAACTMYRKTRKRSEFVTR